MCKHFIDTAFIKIEAGSPTLKESLELLEQVCSIQNNQVSRFARELHGLLDISQGKIIWYLTLEILKYADNFVNIVEKFDTLEMCLQVLEKRTKDNWEATKPVTMEILNFILIGLSNSSTRFPENSTGGEDFIGNKIYKLICSDSYTIHNRTDHKQAWDVSEKIKATCKSQWPMYCK